MENREFDIIVFGASGVTGHYVFEELAQVAKKENIKFALAGRSEKKLKSVIEESKKYLQSNGETIDDVPIILANVNDENSLLEMCKKTKLVMNCVGHSNLYGESVIKACITVGTHQLDLNGELMFLREMQLKYHEEAVQKGIYIVQACGFDSIPCDMGVSLIKKKFQGDLNSVEIYLQFNIGSQDRPINAGTWNSIIYGINDKNIHKQLNEKIFKKFPKFSHPISKRPVAFKSEITNSWCVPFPENHKTAAFQSQLFNYNFKNERPAQIKTYFTASLLVYFYLGLIGIMLFIFSKFKFGRHLLKSYPKVFTLGFFQGGGATREQMKESISIITFWAEGWKDKVDVDEQHTEPPNKHMKVVSTAPDSPYITTSFCMVIAGVVCLKESDKMPGSGGVLTPAAAFDNTSLLEQLQKSRMKFSIMEK